MSLKVDNGFGVVDVTGVHRLVVALLHIAEGVVQVLTLTLYRPGWPLEYYVHHLKLVGYHRDEEE